MFKRKRLVHLITFAMVATVCFFGGMAAQQTLPQSSSDTFFDDFPSTATYVINTDGTGIYWTTRSDGKLAYGGSYNSGGVTGTDASEVIQATINGLADGEIFVRRGIYDCNSRITLKSNLSLKGEGIDSTILRLNNGVNDVFVVNEGATTGIWDTNILLEALTLDGNGENQVSGTHIRTNNTSTLYFDHVRDVRIRNVKFYNGRDYNLRLGFSESAGYVENAIIENCIVNKTTNERGGNSDGWGKNVIYVNCEAMNSARDGFTHWGKGVHYSGCTSHNNAHDGFYAEGPASEGSSEDFAYVECTAYNNTGGISVYNVRHVRIIGGEYHSNKQHGLWLRQEHTHDVHILGAQIFDNSQEGVGLYDGIQVGTSVKRATIEASTICDRQEVHTQGRGISIAGNVNFVSVIGCTVANNTEEGIIIAANADNSLIIGNTIIGNAGFGISVLHNNCDNTGIYNNNLIGQAPNARINDANPTSTEKRNNLGYVTENSGTAILTLAFNSSGIEQITLPYNFPAAFATTPTFVHATTNTSDVSVIGYTSLSPSSITWVFSDNAGVDLMTTVVVKVHWNGEI